MNYFNLQRTFSVPHQVVPLADPAGLARAGREPVGGDGGQPPLEGARVLVAGRRGADQVSGRQRARCVAAAEAELGTDRGIYCRVTMSVQYIVLNAQVY